MVDRYAEFATDNLSFAATRIERGMDLPPDGNVASLVTFASQRRK